MSPPQAATYPKLLNVFMGTIDGVLTMVEETFSDSHSALDHEFPR
jgi:hypothetical protein